MNVETLWSLLAFLLPPAVDYVNRKVKSGRWKFIIATASSTLVGFVVVAFQSQWDWQNVLGSAVLAFTAAQVAYKLYWSKTDVHKDIVGKLEDVEEGMK